MATRRSKIANGSALLALALATLTIAPTGVAHADSNAPAGGAQPGVGNVTGGDVTPAGSAPAMTQQAKDKVAATLAWAAALRAGKSADAAAKAANAYTAKYGGAAPAAPSAAASRFLGVAQVGQNTSYYCGPASGYEMIRYLHGAGFTSRYDGSAPGQAGLANANHMATDANRSTAWSSGRYVTGVNRWRGSSYYVQVHAPTSLTGVFSFSIGDNGMPFAGDTVEIANGNHYNGHPRDKLIGHWLTAYGYVNSGAIGYWVDSSTTVFPAARPSFGYDSASFNGFLQTNGVAY